MQAASVTMGDLIKEFVTFSHSPKLVYAEQNIEENVTVFQELQMQASLNCLFRNGRVSALLSGINLSTMVSNEGHKTSYIKFAVKWIAVYLLPL